ncbi:hypothetical protein JQ607_16220 [Bradyrhizobium liaoningense]|uniref:hypothetical protein n=1 Tax=Bradyrhizobium liaoningense TaxID=43992 RepID=UPI001BA8C71A|nr:hypothetical protein [Bradyrhizobium liaoningense]MBR0841744.1 hypothetical protein [Bradyrhizobium liaoningense]
MTASLLPELLGLLEPYLERKVEEWLAQPEVDRRPTLPSTVDGKVNVRAVAAESNIGIARVQHLFKRDELRSAVNAVALEQLLKPIGARLPSDDVEKEVATRMRRTEARANELGTLVAEQAATIERQRREIAALREQLRSFEDTGQIIRTAEVTG